MICSEFGVKNEPPCADLKIGFTTICFVSKSCKSMIAILGLALSLIANHFPSYFAFVSERPGWCVSPQLISLPLMLPCLKTANESLSYPYPCQGSGVNTPIYFKILIDGTP